MTIGTTFQKIAESLSSLRPGVAAAPLEKISASSFDPLGALQNSLGLKGLPGLFATRPYAFERPEAPPLGQVLPSQEIAQFLERTRTASSDARYEPVADMFQLLNQLQTMQPARSPESRW